MKYRQSTKELKKHWDEQLRFLRKSAREYDKGDESEAKRMATNLRILFHETNKSHSLLKQLNSKEIKNNFLFLSSSGIYIPANLIPTSTLLVIESSISGSKYKSIGMSSKDLHLLTFNDWWNEIIFDDKKNKFTRKDIILLVSNQDGGAHIDPYLDEKYAELTKFNSLGWVDCNGNAIGGNPAYAAIRQITTEILLSEDISYKKLIRREKVINREFDMIFVNDKKRFAWVVTNDESLLGESCYRRENRKVYIQKYEDGTRLPILTL